MQTAILFTLRRAAGYQCIAFPSPNVSITSFNLLVPLEPITGNGFFAVEQHKTLVFINFRFSCTVFGVTCDVTSLLRTIPGLPGNADEALYVKMATCSTTPEAKHSYCDFVASSSEKKGKNENTQCPWGNSCSPKI